MYTNTIIEDTVNWVKIQGSFTANGTERFITVGNFFANNNTDTIGYWGLSNEFAYYLLDDVSVIASDAVAHAGTDVLIGLGDTVHIGTYEEGMPCEWYVLGGTVPVGYGGGIDVHPVATTTYVVKMDLCSNVTYDTMKVYVVPAGVSALGLGADLVQLYPNPATTQLHIDHAANCAMQVYDMTCRQVVQCHLASNQEVVEIASIAKGVYMVQLTDGEGRQVTKRLVKE